MTEESGTLQGMTNEKPHGALMLRRHKMLPHPIRQLDLTLDTPSLPTIDVVEMRSPEELQPAIKEAGAPQLPPTPPTNTRFSGSSDKSILTPLGSKQNIMDGFPKAPSLSTLRSGQSPPTPDFTPPRQSRPTFAPLTQNTFQSSRSNSFTTAPEDPYTSDEDVGSNPLMTLMLPARSSKSCSTLSDLGQTPDVLELLRIEDLQSKKVREQSLARPKSLHRGTVRPEKQDLLTSSELEDQNFTKRDSDLRNINMRQNANNRNEASEPLHVNEGTERTTQASFYFPIQPTEYIPSNHSREITSQLRYAELDGVSSTRVIETEDRSLSPSLHPISNTRNMASQSHRSTVLGAPLRGAQLAQPKTLRHMKKRIISREYTGQTNGIPDDFITNNLSHSQYHSSQPVPKIFESLYPKAERSGIKDSALGLKKRKEIIRNGGIPVLVIPERITCGRSSKPPSLKSKSSRKTRRSISFNSAPTSFHQKIYDCEHTHLSWKDNLISKPLDLGHVELNDQFSSSIPIRESFLSGQTTQCTSRTNSLTTESLRTHDQLLAKNPVPKPNLSLLQNTSLNNSNTSSEISGFVTIDPHDDPQSGHNPLYQVIPYSQSSSYETAGTTTAEISEALAVSLFTHRTKSITVLQYPSSQDSYLSDPDERKTNSMSPALSSQFESCVKTDSVCETKVESPFQNPRDAPEPPVITFHPPTPRTIEENSLSAFEASHSVLELLDKNISVLDDAISQTSSRRILSFHTQPAHQIRHVKYPLNMDSTYLDEPFPRVDVPDQGKLHPFWQPSKFWCDNGDFDRNQTSRNQRKTLLRRTLSERLKRSIGMLPMQKSRESSSTFVGHQSAIQTSKLPFRVKQQQSKGGHKYNTRLNIDGNKDWGLNFKEGNGGRVHSFSGLGLRIENLRWNELRRWVSEKKRENRKLGRAVSST